MTVAAQTIEELPPEMRGIARRYHQKLMGSCGKPLAGFLRLLAAIVDRGDLNTELTDKGIQFLADAGCDEFRDGGLTLQFGDVFFNVAVVDEPLLFQELEQSDLPESGGDCGITEHGALVIRQINRSEA